MTRKTVDFGIDLGTTNSAITLQEWEEIEVIPSVVHLTDTGLRRVGKAAREQLEHDPDNTKAEFKRLMGTTTKLSFDASGRSLTPEELSAEVLKHLIESAREKTGEEIDCAVITVPALFEIPQNEATERAAALAGITFAPLLQEPIAAALAYGFGREERTAERSFWMVYDFGGGTFDVSIVSIRDGRLSVVDHDGDNFLGGKDLDKRLLELVVRRVEEQHAIPALVHGHDDYSTLMSSLRIAVERGREELSTNTETLIAVRDLARNEKGETIDLEVAVSRMELDRLVLPEISRSVDICERLLDRNRLTSDDVERLVRSRLLPAQITPLDAEDSANADVSLSPRQLGGWGSHAQPYTKGCILDVAAAVMHTLADIYGSIATRGGLGLAINLHLTADTPLAEVVSVRETEALLTVRPYAPDNVLVRMPAWVPRGSVQLSVNGSPCTPQTIGPWLFVPRETLRPGSRIEFRHALPTRTTTETWPSGRSYRLRWRGDQVVAVAPRDTPLAVYPADEG